MALRKTTVQAELASMQQILTHWQGRLDKGELPFTDDDDPIEPEEDVLRHFIADMALVSRKAEAMVEIEAGTFVDG